MTNNLLSICCLGYNHACFLEDNIRSICAINYPHIEIIAVDDGSQDGSVDLLKKLAAEIPLKMTVIAQENTGNIGKNFNTALHHAQGELIAFIAMDDVFNPPVVLQQIQSMTANPRLLFNAATKIVSINNEGIANSSKNSPPNPPANTLDKPTTVKLLELEYSHFGGFYIQGCIFRKNILDTVGGFDEDQTGDDIVLRTKILRYMVERQCEDFELTKANACFYRLHDNNIHKNSIRQIRNVTEYLERYWPDRDVPDALVSWAVYAIRNNDFNESIRIFSMNKVAASLLQNKEVQKILQASAYASYKEDSKKLITKERIKDIRIITLFGNIVFSYKKKLKQRNPAHS